MIQAHLTGEIPHIIKSINGVIGFLGETVGGDPVPLRESEVNRMLGKVDELAVKDETVSIPFTVGETVVVTDGPFRDFTGTIVKINEERRKLAIMVKIFERRSPLELNYTQVKKVQMLYSNKIDYVRASTDKKFTNQKKKWLKK